MKHVGFPLSRATHLLPGTSERGLQMASAGAELSCRPGITAGRSWEKCKLKVTIS